MYFQYILPLNIYMATEMNEAIIIIVDSWSSG